MYIKPIYNFPEEQFIGGESRTFEFHIYHKQNGNPIDMDNVNAAFSVIDFSNKIGTPLFTKMCSISEGKHHGINNLVTVRIDPSDTALLYGKYVYQLSIQHIDSGIVEIPGQGILRILKNINQRFVLKR